MGQLARPATLRSNTRKTGLSIALLVVLLILVGCGSDKPTGSILVSTAASTTTTSESPTTSVSSTSSATEPSSGTSPSTSQAGPPPGSAAQIETLLGFIRPWRTSGDIFLPVTDLSPHEQPSFPKDSQGARAGYRINYEVDVDGDRWLTLGMDLKELTDAYLGLKAEKRLTPTGISLGGNEWQRGKDSDGDVILGVEIPAADSADPYVLTIRVKTIDTALGVEVAGSMRQFANP